MDWRTVAAWARQLQLFRIVLDYDHKSGYSEDCLGVAIRYPLPTALSDQLDGRGPDVQKLTVEGVPLRVTVKDDALLLEYFAADEILVDSMSP